MERYQCLVAVFDNWDTLTGMIAHLSPDQIGGSGAVLYANSGTPENASLPDLLLDMTELNLLAGAACVQCTTGKLATELHARSKGGADTVAAAVCDWLGDGMANELQRHIENGRFVLWLEPVTPDDCEKACAELVRASPHLVFRFYIQHQS